MQRTVNITRPKGLEDLLTPDLVARLGQLDITSRKVFSGKLKGERRSKRRGESVEFADHRPYVSGDDLRHIDWNIFARLDHLFLKLFLEEEDLSLQIIIDCSASHDCGEPNKFLFMQRLAASLGYIGLVNLNRVGITAIGAKEVEAEDGAKATGEGGQPEEVGLLSTLRDLRGRRRLSDLVRYLCTLEPIGTTRFTDACKKIAITRRGKGVMIILSDFFYKEGYETGLRLLKGHGYDLFAIQVLSPQEMEPNIGGDLRLKDVEDGDSAEVTISAPLLKKYRQILNAYCNRLHEFCAQRDIVHMTVKSDMGIDSLVMDYLRRRGLLR
ncbi:MAG: DUF58 domain-containing protein [Phycisphaerales bacterium]|nr:DUF58 domain-containing protein [Phycisphaerales bacterium]